MDPDVVRYSENGSQYAVFGLRAKADSIRAAAQHVDALMNARKLSATKALRTWTGPHTATFADLNNRSSDALADLAQALSLVGISCATFPASVTSSSTIGEAFRMARAGARVPVPKTGRSVGAETDDLRAYATTVCRQGEGLVALASRVSYEGLRAEVTQDVRLTTQQRADALAAGIPARVLDLEARPVTQPYPVRELITLVAPLDQASRAVQAAGLAMDFAAAVAAALDLADTTRLHLLAEHPELAAFLTPGGAPERVAGDTAVAVLLAHFADIAARTGDSGGIDRRDLEAAADDASLPAEARRAARYLLDNPTLLRLVETGSDADGFNADGSIASDYRATEDDLTAFLEANRRLRDLYPAVDRIDNASGGDPDGSVSFDDLRAAADDETLPRSVRDAAAYLVHHPAARRSLLPQEGPTGFHGVEQFSTDQLIARLVNGQAYAHDPDEARAFTATLPLPARGGQGLTITLCQSDGVEALANAALLSADGDLMEMQAVISHLPETTEATRNELITGFYDLLARRLDNVVALASGAVPGHPDWHGHPGANFLHFAVWASDRVHGAIDGSLSAWRIHLPEPARQAAAAGNQWIFDDITTRFAAFVDLYESSAGRPSTDQPRSFFNANFRDGDLQIRTGFQAYVAALAERDPARRQQLMFQANTLVVTHEQAGLQPYLEGASRGPDTVVAEYTDVRVGSHCLDVNRDLRLAPTDSNLVVPARILDLDPSELDPSTLTPQLHLPPITGWEGRFDVSTKEWYDRGGKGTEYPFMGGPVAVGFPVEVDPDATLEGTGANRWTRYDQRMWFIHRMFEQLHTDPSLYDTSSIGRRVHLEWVDPSVPLSIR